MRRAAVSEPQRDIDIAGVRMGLKAGTKVMTTKGIQAVETLMSGDRVITKQGAIALISLRNDLNDGFVLEFDEAQTVLLSDACPGRTTWVSLVN